MLLLHHSTTTNPVVQKNVPAPNTVRLVKTVVVAPIAIVAAIVVFVVPKLTKKQQ